MKKLLCTVTLIFCSFNSVADCVDPKQLYMQFKNEATKIAMEEFDVEIRAAYLLKIYKESKGNHVFPLLAAHGALWAKDEYKTYQKTLENLNFFGIANISHETIKKIFTVNKKVFIDTYTNYFFTQACRGINSFDTYFEMSGHPQRRQEAINSFEALIDIHVAAESCDSTCNALTEDQKINAYHHIFIFEQEVTVSEEVKTAQKYLNENIFQYFFPKTISNMIEKPSVKFKFFGNCEPIEFASFFSKDERISNGQVSIEIAFCVGLEFVEQSLDNYITKMKILKSNQP